MATDLEALLVNALGIVSSSPSPMGLCLSHVGGRYRIDLVMIADDDKIARGEGATIQLALTAVLFGMYRIGQRARARR